VTLASVILSSIDSVGIAIIIWLLLRKKDN